jgi:hypothetical protein
VAPGAGGDDDGSDEGLEELLLQDEEARAGKDPKALKVKPGAKGKGGSSGVVAVAGDGNDGEEAADDALGRVKVKSAAAHKAEKAAALASARVGSSLGSSPIGSPLASPLVSPRTATGGAASPPTVPAGGTMAVAPDSSKEVVAGQLKASADTETGTKQRRVNKRLQNYEQGGGAAAGGAGAGADKKKNS